MKVGTATGYLGPLAAGLLAVFLPAGDVWAQDGEVIASGILRATHRHDPIDVDARPIMSRISVPLMQPRRMLIDPLGNLFIADWGAGTVLKVTPEEQVTIVASGLNEPAGLALDRAGNLYVAMHAEGMTQSGSVVQISPMGEQTVYASGLTGPTALAFDAMGHLFVANFHNNNIAVVRMEGQVEMFVENIPGPAALAFDTAGMLYVVSSTEGILFRITPMGETGVLARGLLVPSDIALDPKGHLIVSNYAGTELSYVSKRGAVRTFALVPKGTISSRFDRAGNLFLLNWDEPLLLKIISQLSVPCPHCEKQILLRFRPKPKKSKPAKPAGPMI